MRGCRDRGETARHLPTLQPNMITHLHEPPGDETDSAWEFVFPLDLEEASPHQAMLRRVAAVTGTSAGEVTNTVKNRFASIASPEVRSFLQLFEGFEPYSVLIKDTVARLVYRFTKTMTYCEPFISLLIGQTFSSGEPRVRH